MKMKIAVMADIHGNHIALETCIDEAKRRGAEEYLFLGDYLGELAYPEKTLNKLDQLKKEYPCTFIRGNKENYWIDQKNGKNSGWIWNSGSSSTGILKYVYDHLTAEQIEEFEKMPISKRLEYPGLPAFVICHGSPWKVNESMREDYDYIDGLTQKLETALTLCAHFHIQSKYQRNGHTVINPGAVGVPLRSGGKTQFMMLSGVQGEWIEELLTLPYDMDRAIQEMDAEHLSEQAPGWYRITKQVLKGGSVTHLTVLSRAAELYRQDTGIQNWRNIPEKYWETALNEFDELKEAKHV